MPKKVFLCYSQKDRGLFEAFRTHLAPFIQEGLLQLWSDQDILAAEDWDSRINEAIMTADGAVLLVSPDMLASTYVTRTEIPLLLQAAESGRLQLTALYLRPSNVEVRQFDVVEAITGQRGIRITKYQGLNSPREPIAEQGRSDQDQLLASAARKLWNTLERTPNQRERRRTIERRELTIELCRRSGGHLDRRYSKPRHEGLYQSRGTLRLPQLLDPAEEFFSITERGEWGSQLFAVLFGGDSEWPVILRMASGEDVHSPVRHPMRVRIVTSDPELRSLPWAACQWQHYPLADTQQGWTFELGVGMHPTPVVRLHTPCSAVMISAEVKGMSSLHCEAHHAGLEQLLGQVWNHPPRQPYIKWVRTSSEIEALSQELPRLVYLYGHAREGRQGLELVLENEEGHPAPMPLMHLAKLLESYPPQIVFLHTVGSCPLFFPFRGVPLMLHLRRPEASFRARQEAQAWWEDVLGNRWDPVRAFHEMGTEARLCGTVQTDYDIWETSVSEYTPKVDRPRSRLDRTSQREAVLHAVRDLVTNRRRRVTCILAYGAPGNMTHLFSGQSVYTLKDWAKDLARIHYHLLRLPDQRESLSPEQLEEHFRELMQIQPFQDLEVAFGSERRGGPQAVPVHFLDWRTYGRNHLPPLTTGHLESWLTFCCDRLSRACTGKTRIICYIALEMSEPRHGILREWVERWRERPAFRQSHFDLLALPALGRVSANDLVRFLEDEDNTSCPREYLRDIPDRIIAATGGDFEATVLLLERAEHGMMWPELYETLPKAPTKAIRQEGVLLE